MHASKASEVVEVLAVAVDRGVELRDDVSKDSTSLLLASKDDML